MMTDNLLSNTLVCLSAEAEWSAMDTNAEDTAVYVGDGDGDMAAYDPHVPAYTAHENCMPVPVELFGDEWQFCCSAEAEWSAMDTNAEGMTVYVGDGDGDMAVYDLRLNEAVKPIHDAVCCSAEAEWLAMDTNAEGTTVYVGDGDGDMAVYDLRLNAAVNPVDSAVCCSAEAEWSAMDTNAEGTTVYVGDNDGDMAVYDPRSDAAVLEPFHVYERKVNTLHVGLPCLCRAFLCSAIQGPWSGCQAWQLDSAFTHSCG